MSAMLTMKCQCYIFGICDQDFWQCTNSGF